MSLTYDILFFLTKSHLMNIKQAFDKLRATNLEIKTGKCTLLKAEIKF